MVKFSIVEKGEAVMKVKTLVLGLLQTNCFLLTSESLPGQCLLIDPASDGQRILETLKKEGLTLEGILLTHSHFDHMSALDVLSSATGAPFFCPQKDEKGLTDGRLNGSLVFMSSALTVKTAPQKLLFEGDELFLGDEKLTVLETPGHTAGSVCYKTEGAIFTGDTLFCHGVGRTDLPGGSSELLLSSVQRLLSLENLVAYPGHGQTTLINEERRFLGF